MKKKTTENFIEDAIKVHGNKYDYSLVEYINTRTKVKIICKKHGVFEQSPYVHLTGSGCKKCISRKYTLNEFLEKCNKIHNNKYDYSLVDYKFNNTKVKIICPIHGVFEQNPNHHLNGHSCKRCNCKNFNTKNNWTNEIFIEKSNIVHNNKYDY